MRLLDTLFLCKYVARMRYFMCIFQKKRTPPTKTAEIRSIYIYTETHLPNQLPAWVRAWYWILKCVEEEHFLNIHGGGGANLWSSMRQSNDIYQCTRVTPSRFCSMLCYVWKRTSSVIVFNQIVFFRHDSDYKISWKQCHVVWWKHQVSIWNVEDGIHISICTFIR